MNRAGIAGEKTPVKTGKTLEKTGKTRIKFTNNPKLVHYARRGIIRAECPIVQEDAGVNALSRTPSSTNQGFFCVAMQLPVVYCKLSSEFRLKG